MKKLFECGHKGKGQFCHRCKQEELRMIEAENQRQAKQDEKDAEKQKLAEDRISLVNIPKRLHAKTRKILKDVIDRGLPFAQFGGKRMQYNRNHISIPINRDYRIIIHQQDSTLVPIKALSHEDYNARKPCELS
jgi:hypothetical protein